MDSARNAGEGQPGLEGDDPDFESASSGSDVPEDFYEQPDWVQATRDSVSAPQATDPVKYEVPTHHSLSSLEQSAIEGCHLCNVIWDAIPAEYTGHEASNARLWRTLKADSKQAIGVVVVRPRPEKTESDNDLALEVSYFRNGKHDDESAYILTASLELRSVQQKSMPTYRYIGPSTGTRHATLQHLERWAKDCIEDHADCKYHQRHLQDREDSFHLPTRLIEIGNESNGTLLLKLRETERLVTGVRYNTLSHCWGPTLHVSLTKENYKDFLEAIPVKALSKNFLDAAQVSGQLGLRYLWIDALCIIQNSHKDWVREALRMASVYSNSYYNLAATASVDGNGGLLQANANLRFANPCFVEASWTGLPAGTYLCFDGGQWNRRIESAVLNKRAWVLQERLLAPRTVHFARDQVWWECSQLRACETWPFGVPEDRFHFQTDAVTAFRQFDPGDADGSHDSWLSLVRTYTASGLTKPQDKLVALAGIAKSVHSSLSLAQDDYIAGLWKCQLPLNLLWSKRSAGTRALEYRAPSWSWASVEGEIHCHSSQDRAAVITDCAVRLLDCSVTTASQSPFGPVENASLQLTGPLYSATLADPVQGDQNDHRMTKLVIKGIQFIENDTFAEALDDDKLYSASSISTFFLRVFTTSSPYLDEERMSEGLALERVAGKNGRYRRVGWLRIFHRDAEEFFHARLRSKLKPIEYEEDRGNGFYRLSIV